MKQKIIGVIVAILAVFGISVSTNNLGSVERSHEYQATSTYAVNGSPLFVNPNASLCANTSGVLGSVVINGAVAGRIVIMNATSTTDVSSTTLAVIPASAAVGTYTYDLIAPRGLHTITATGLVPTSTITFKCS